MFTILLPAERRPLAVAALVVLSSASFAQVPRLIGGASSAATGPLIAVQPFCGPSARLCSPVLAAPTAAYGGGTAYDPIRQVVWDTDGARLTGVLATSTPPCQVYCAPVPAPVPAGALATGLAFDESRNALWMIDSSPSLALLRFVATTTCPQVSARCDLTAVIPANHEPGSLAFSERRQLVLWSSSVFTGGGAANIVYLAPAADPCNPTCRITLFGTVGCGGGVLGPITGLAYDDCTDQIYATDGRAVLRATYVPPCAAINFTCCAAALVAPYYGLCIEPVHPTSRGASCLDAACGACPNLRLETIGDPTLGNSAFALRIAGAPVGSVGVAMLTPGGCAAGVPWLCGLYHLVGAPFFVGIGGLAGGAACTGTRTFGLPIPLDPALCSSPFCVQGAVVCLPAGFGVTNAFDLRIFDT